MTCIIGLVHDNNVYMAGDSMVANGWDMRRIGIPKVFRNNLFLMGCTGIPRMGQLLQFELKVPEQLKEQDDYVYMVVEFVGHIRELFNIHGFMWKDHDREAGGEFLVGYRNALYQVNSDFSVLQYIDKYAALGVGRAYALGSMYGSVDTPPKKRLRQALKAAAHFSNGVTAPFCIKKL